MTLYFNPIKKHYYNIETIFNYFKDCEEASTFLQSIIEQSSPDYFHWTDVHEAITIKKGV